MKHILMTLTLMACLSLAACSADVSALKDAFGDDPAKNGDKLNPQQGFQDLQGLIGEYRLKSFEGRDFSNRYIHAAIELDTTSVRDKNNSYSIKMLNMPLFTYVNSDSGSSSTLDLGPLDGLGEYVSISSGTNTTYGYKFNGPIIYEYRAVTLILDMTIESTLVDGKKNLKVNYTAEIPGHVSKTTRSFVLTQ